jgi:hypothetical protein
MMTIEHEYSVGGVIYKVLDPEGKEIKNAEVHYEPCAKDPAFYAVYVTVDGIQRWICDCADKTWADVIVNGLTLIESM